MTNSPRMHLKRIKTLGNLPLPVDDSMVLFPDQEEPDTIQ